MSYEPYRRVKAEEMVAVAHRRLIAVIDMVSLECRKAHLLVNFLD